MLRKPRQKEGHEKRKGAIKSTKWNFCGIEKPKERNPKIAEWIERDTVSKKQ